MRSALAAHDKVLRSAIEAHDGFLFKHTGDGVVAAFESPTAAVAAAIDAQRELQLPVRIGIATGEAELRDGDYFGTVLNRAARVMAAGHGGQVLVADSTAGLLGSIDLLSLGVRRLRDVASPITVYQVQAAGLRTDFPPLRTLDPTPGNLRRAASGSSDVMQKSLKSLGSYGLGDWSHSQALVASARPDLPSKSPRCWPMIFQTAYGFSNLRPSATTPWCRMRSLRFLASPSSPARP